MKAEVAVDLVKRIVEMCQEEGCQNLVIGVQVDAKDGNRYTEEDDEQEVVYVRQTGDESAIGKIRRTMIAMDYEDTSRLVTR